MKNFLSFVKPQAVRRTAALCGYIFPALGRAALVCGILFTFFSCEFWESKTAVLWTDRPEFVFYAEQFNASQDRYKIEVFYYESVAQELTNRTNFPDIAAASWLKSVSTRSLFSPLDNLFTKDSGAWGFFYPKLLDLGRIEDKQYLVPVSFNIPAMVFGSEHSRSMSNPFTISMEEIKERGKAYNVESGGVYTRMGFSPSWNEEFLFIVAALMNAGFREASPIAWDAMTLEQAILWVQTWITEANTSIQAEDDFVFKYLYDPPARLLSSGRILFTYMDSVELFTMAEERWSNLDFRWIAEKNAIPVEEGAVFLGIHRRTKAKSAALAFTRWFFRADTQRLLLETSKEKRLLETSFGIGGGFSAMRTVTEQVFPLFYPSLLGRMPPEDFLSPPSIVPRNWKQVKEKVIIPYLRERVRNFSGEELRALELRITDWYRLNRD